MAPLTNSRTLDLNLTFNEPLFQHHVIPRHIWSRTFGNLVGWNTAKNRIWVTAKEHAEEHHKLYIRYGLKQDLKAVAVIMGRANPVKEMALREKLSKLKMGNQAALGSTRGPEESKIHSAAQTGKIRGPYKKRNPLDPVVLRERRWRSGRKATAAPAPDSTKRS